MKILALIPAALMAASPAMAGRVDPGFSQSYITRGDAYAIRSCGDAYGIREDVCYNQVTSGVIDLRGIGIDFSRSRVVRVDCDRRHGGKTTRGAVAREFCPQVEAGTLAPAPFLF